MNHNTFHYSAQASPASSTVLSSVNASLDMSVLSNTRSVWPRTPSSWSSIAGKHLSSASKRGKRPFMLLSLYSLMTSREHCRFLKYALQGTTRISSLAGRQRGRRCQQQQWRAVSATPACSKRSLTWRSMRRSKVLSKSYLSRSGRKADERKPHDVLVI